LQLFVNQIFQLFPDLGLDSLYKRVFLNPIDLDYLFWRDSLTLSSKIPVTSPIEWLDLKIFDLVSSAVALD
jgi:hypothetical protein